LALALIILGIGALLIPTFLAYTSTKLLASRAIEESLKEQYAADAGMEYALWHLGLGGLEVPEGGQEELPEFTVNNKTVNVSVENEGDGIYKITSTATSGDGSSTTIVSYVKIVESKTGDSSGSPVFENAVVSLDGDVVLTGSSRVLAEGADCEANVHANGDIHLAWSTYIDGTASATGIVDEQHDGNYCEEHEDVDPLDPPEVITSTYKAEAQDVQCAQCAACGDYTVEGPWDEPAGTYGRVHARDEMNIGDWRGGFTFTDTVCAGITTTKDIDIVWSDGEVTFEGSVKAGRNLDIEGSQTITFKGPVCVGQDLNIQSGPGEVIFEGPVQVSRNMYIGGGRPVTFESTVCVGQLLEIRGSGNLIFEKPVKVGGNLDIGGGRPTNLNDTLYVEGDMIVSGGEDIPLGGTVYVCGDIVMSGTGFRGGETIVAEGDVTLSGSVKLNKEDIPCVISLGDEVSFSGDTWVSAAVYAPNAHIELSGSSKVYGALVGKSVDMLGDVKVEYPPGLGDREDLPGGGDESGDEGGELEIITYNINP